MTISVAQGSASKTKTRIVAIAAACIAAAPGACAFAAGDAPGAAGGHDDALDVSLIDDRGTIHPKVVPQTLSPDLVSELKEATSDGRTIAQDREVPQAIVQAFREAQSLSAEGNHYSAAAIFFNIYTGETPYRLVALGHVAEELIRGGFPNAASYFFIKTLESGNRAAIRRVVGFLPIMLDAVGGDLLRPYVLRHTSEADYDAATRNHFYYFLGKDELWKGSPQKALQALSKVSSGSGVMAQAAYLRGAAYAMLGQHSSAVASFESCQRSASRLENRDRSMRQEGEDLEARCTAGLARAYYQSGEHEKAEETYDDIPKSSFVWTDILFEQAWNAYAKGDYNRALGKLVTYRSPSLNFVFNPEVDVLRAQSFLALCDYQDVGKTVQEFERRYESVGGQMKNFLLSHDKDLASYFGIAKEAMRRKLHTGDMFARALNRFIRGPHFASFLSQERSAQGEASRLNGLAAARNAPRFAGFLQKVVAWRGKTVRLLGGLFVRNSLYDLYQDLVADLDKMSFIKLEELGRAKSKLERKHQILSEDETGVAKRGGGSVDRKNYQYFWSFNGEFWADELGDYVFALESQCGS